MVPNITKENQYKRTKSYHSQPHTRRINSKIKKMKRKPDHPPPFQPYSTHYNRAIKKRKPVQSRHPLQANTQLNCTGPALHTAESHTENI
jgi:hypothetical protein